MKYQIINGNNIDVLKTFPDNHFDSIVTDPPYGIDFLGKAWDANTGALETYQQCLRVLKPGGHILAFSAARTYHHLAITLEQAGFEIRDQIMWIYSSGFPKSQDIGRSIQRSMGVKEYDGVVDTTKNTGFGQMDVARQKVGQEWSTKETQVGKAKVTDPEAKAWEGWGTSLKPAHEPIALARKPLKQSIAKNCQQYGVGALNIDAARVPYESEADIQTYLNNKAGPAERGTGQHGEKINMFEKSVGYKNIKKTITREEDLPEGRFPSNVLGEIPDYQKYFYCPKVSRRERHTGFDPNSQGVIIDSEVFGKTPVCLDCGKTRNGSTKHDGCDPENIGFQERRTERSTEVGNNHPTVKPIELMKYLIKLVTPKGGIVLDPFNGSGSTGCAAVELGHEYVGIELDPAYVEIANKRIEAWNKQDTSFKEIFE
jgi:site-specific DNA-methyltransferase (adenine-specific)